MPTATNKYVGLGPKLYCLWAALAVGLAIVLNGFSPENITRLLVIAFLFVQIALRSIFVKALPQCEAKVRFIVLATVLAAVVEGFHMISMPVFYRCVLARIRPSRRD